MDGNGIPIGWAIAPANRHDSKLVEPTLDVLTRSGLIGDIDTIYLDKGYDYRFVDDLVAQVGIHDAVIVRKRKPHEPTNAPRPWRIDRRWVVERTNSWLTDFGQLRRNTDRKTIHRLAQLALAITALITAKLIDWRNRWNPDPAPIR